jgi:hypothetical protein
MAKTKRRHTQPHAAREQSPQTAEDSNPPLFEPLPLPRRNKALLGLAAALVALWIVALVALVLWGSRG